MSSQAPSRLACSLHFSARQSPRVLHLWFMSINWSLNRLAARLFTNVPSSIDHGMKHLQPIIQHRRKMMEEYGKDYAEKPVSKGGDRHPEQMLTCSFMLERFPKLANGRCRCRRASWQGTGSTHLDSQLCCYPHIFTRTLTRSIICLAGFLIFLHRVLRMRYIN